LKSKLIPHLGLTSRFCAGTHTNEAKWGKPNFSRCVTDKYEELYHEVKILWNLNGRIFSGN